MKTKTIQQAWDQAKNNLSSQKGKLSGMLEPCQVAGRENGSIKILAHNEYDAQWLNARASKLVEQQLMGILADDVRVTFEAPPEQEDQDPLDDGPANIMAAYGDNKSSIIKPNQILIVSRYFWHNWKPLLGGTAADIVIAARSLCYWNPKTGELRSKVSTDRKELAQAASCSEKSVTRALKNPLIKRYFVRYRIARTMTDQGSRNLGLNLWVRMDDPLTPEDQEKYNLDEPTTWQLFPDPQA